MESHPYSYSYIHILNLCNAHSGYAQLEIKQLYVDIRPCITCSQFTSNSLMTQLGKPPQMNGRHTITSKVKPVQCHVRYLHYRLKCTCTRFSETSLTATTYGPLVQFFVFRSQYQVVWDSQKSSEAHLHRPWWLQIRKSNGNHVKLAQNEQK